MELHLLWPSLAKFKKFSGYIKLCTVCVIIRVLAAAGPLFYLLSLRVASGLLALAAGKLAPS